MTLRKWAYLFWTTLLIGSAFCLAAGLIIRFADPAAPKGAMELLVISFMFVLFGSAISVLSQMGFFAYLFLRFFLKGFTAKRWMQDMIQWIIIIIALFDLVYLRYDAQQGSFLNYVTMPIVLVGVSILTAWRKVKLTNRTALTPTLFFMIVVTAIESVPVLRVFNAESTFLMVLPLLACNAWQILILHKITETPKSRD